MANTKNRRCEVKSAMVEILNLAIDMLWDGKDAAGKGQTGICSCISLAGTKYLNYTYSGKHGDRIEKEVGRLADRITSSFDGKAAWVDYWLLHNGHITTEQYENRTLIQAYRKRWLEALRAEYVR